MLEYDKKYSWNFQATSIFSSQTFILVILQMLISMFFHDRFFYTYIKAKGSVLFFLSLSDCFKFLPVILPPYSRNITATFGSQQFFTLRLHFHHNEGFFPQRALNTHITQEIIRHTSRDKVFVYIVLGRVPVQEQWNDGRTDSNACGANNHPPFSNDVGRREGLAMVFIPSRATCYIFTGHSYNT